MISKPVKRITNSSVAQIYDDTNELYEYEVGATVDNVHKTMVRFLRGHLTYYKYKGTALNYGLDLIQETYPNSIVEFDYIKEYDNVVD